MCVCVLTCRAVDGAVSTTNGCFDCLKVSLENGGKGAIFGAIRTKRTHPIAIEMRRHTAWRVAGLRNGMKTTNASEERARTLRFETCRSGQEPPNTRVDGLETAGRWWTA